MPQGALKTWVLVPSVTHLWYAAQDLHLLLQSLLLPGCIEGLSQPNPMSSTTNLVEQDTTHLQV